MLINKLWGTEDWVVNESYCMKVLTLLPGYQCSLHFHPIKDECFYVAQGTVMLSLDGRMRRLETGEYVRIKPGTLHRFHCASDSGPAIIVESSTTHSDDDVVRLEESRKI